jgi:hypothetical protein
VFGVGVALRRDHPHRLRLLGKPMGAETYRRWAGSSEPIDVLGGMRCPFKSRRG